MNKIGHVIFSSNLLTLRRGRGLTQDEVASLSGISLRKYQRLENLESSPSLDDIYKLAQALRVETHTLINQAKDCSYTIGTDRFEIFLDKDPHAIEFLKFLDDYFIPKYGVDNQKMINADDIFKDSVFINHQLRLAFTNFKMNVYNKCHGLDKNGSALEFMLHTSEAYNEPNILIPHFNRILNMKEEYYYFDASNFSSRSNKEPWYVLGYVHRKKENYFAVIVKLQKKWSKK